MSAREAPIAQLDRALPSEGKGRTFESCWVHQILSDAGLVLGGVIWGVFDSDNQYYVIYGDAILRRYWRFIRHFLSDVRLRGAAGRHGKPMIYLSNNRRFSEGFAAQDTIDGQV